MSKSKLVSVTFRETTSFGAQHAALGGSGSRFDSIVPAQLLADGDWMPVDKGQRIDGLGLVRRVGPASALRTERFFVPMGNVANLSYGEVAEPSKS